MMLEEVRNTLLEFFDPAAEAPRNTRCALYVRAWPEPRDSELYAAARNLCSLVNRAHPRGRA